MQVDQIRDAIRAQPFRPFALRLVDGTTHIVRHPEWVTIPPVRRPRDIICWVFPENDSDHYRAHWVDVGLVTELIVPWAPAQPAAVQSE
jgi:hypothetical protein